jgi:hypothetical protein
VYSAADSSSHPFYRTPQRERERERERVILIMVGQRTVTKPSRSDEVLDADEQLRIANKIRAQFETLAPKRPFKPNRSEPDSSTPTPLESTAVDESIPELDKFRALRSQSQSHVCNVHHRIFNACFGCFL